MWLTWGKAAKIYVKFLKSGCLLFSSLSLYLALYTEAINFWPQTSVLRLELAELFPVNKLFLTQYSPPCSLWITAKSIPIYKYMLNSPDESGSPLPLPTASLLPWWRKEHLKTNGDEMPLHTLQCATCLSPESITTVNGEEEGTIPWFWGNGISDRHGLLG